MTRKGKVFKEKKLKNSIEIKSEKGSITVFVLSIMLFLITVVVMSYMGISSRMSEQGKQVEKIQAEYNGNTEKMNSIYKELHDESKLYVIYDSNGGEGGPEVQQKTYGETLKLSSETPKRVGYHCTGWSINKDKNSVDYEPGANYEKNATIKLYAVWEANEYTIQYDGNGATSGSTESSIHIYDEDKALTKNNFVRKGYTFKGWSTKKNGSVEYTDEQEVINLSEEHGAKVILYAVWQKNSYTVTYNYTENGGTSATKTSAKVNYGSSIDLTPTATKSGYTFVGWNTNKDGTSKLSSLTMGTSNVTLYAIFKDNIAPTMRALVANTANWTNQNITLTGKAIDIGSGLIAYQFSTSGSLTSSSSGWTTITNTKSEISKTYTVSNNATYYFYVKDKSGNINKKSISVTNIDKTAPTVSLSAAQDASNAGAKVSLSDNVKIAKAVVSNPDGSTLYSSTVNASTYSFTFKNSQNGTYIVKITDVAGNTTTKHMKIKFLFRNNNECTSITGGWNSNYYSYAYGNIPYIYYAKSNGTLVIAADPASGWGRLGTWYTAKEISLSGYDYIRDVKNDENSTSSGALGLWAGTGRYTSKSPSTKNSGGWVYTDLDISDLNDSRKIITGCNGAQTDHYSFYIAIVYMYKIY